jgi:FlaA1/EpsC-like NDP-sugar epimerase
VPSVEAITSGRTRINTVLAEGGDLFLLDISDPVRIKDLAEQMVRTREICPQLDTLDQSMAVLLRVSR